MCTAECRGAPRVCTQEEAQNGVRTQYRHQLPGPVLLCRDGRCSLAGRRGYVFMGPLSTILAFSYESVTLSQ